MVMMSLEAVKIKGPREGKIKLIFMIKAHPRSFPSLLTGNFTVLFRLF
jgi:hypothetical protein